MNLIVAVDENWAIGNKGELLITIPADHKLFRQETMGKVVVYGRKTLATFPQGLALKGRTNIVLSSNPSFTVKDAVVVHSLEELLEELKKYDAYFVGEGEEKVIYLTFDAGYENGNTEPILDALKRHQAPATFFVVGHYLESAPELVKRMVEEGHCVGNHTYHHLDMSQISDMASFRKEMDDVANLFRQITGEELSMYYRPPQGKYSVENLKMAKELGYQTFFWSLAYVDWYQDEQPSREEALEKLTGRIHPGAVVLLHSTSKTNGEVLDELLGEWEKMGYSFRPLSDLIITSRNLNE